MPICGNKRKINLCAKQIPIPASIAQKQIRIFFFDRTFLGEKQYKYFRNAKTPLCFVMIQL